MKWNEREAITRDPTDNKREWKNIKRKVIEINSAIIMDINKYLCMLLYINYT